MSELDALIDGCENALEAAGGYKWRAIKLLAAAKRLRDENQRLRSVLINMQAAWNNKNETTSLYVWNERMKAAMADVEAALTQPAPPSARG